MNPFFLFLIGFISIALIDAVMLSLVIKPLFISKVVQHLSMKGGQLAPSWGAVIAAWALISMGILVFVVYPYRHEPLFHYLLKAALFGLVVYGTYDMTNYAILSNWPLDLVLYDITWGILLCILVSSILYFAVQY